jgi:hypothetical protein
VAIPASPSGVLNNQGAAEGGSYADVVAGVRAPEQERHEGDNTFR